MITLANRTYHICFDQNYTAAVVREWIESGKNQSIILLDILPHLKEWDSGVIGGNLHRRTYATSSQS